MNTISKEEFLRRVIKCVLSYSNEYGLGNDGIVCASFDEREIMALCLHMNYIAKKFWYYYDTDAFNRCLKDEDFSSFWAPIRAEILFQSPQLKKAMDLYPKAGEQYALDWTFSVVEREYT